jgi:hypothetical protein
MSTKNTQPKGKGKPELPTEAEKQHACDMQVIRDSERYTFATKSANEKPLREAYDIRNVDFRNLLTVVMGTVSNRTGESFDSAMLRSKSADEILRRFKNAERLAEAVRDVLFVAKPWSRLPRGTQGRNAYDKLNKALAQWEAGQ